MPLSQQHMLVRKCPFFSFGHRNNCFTFQDPSNSLPSLPRVNLEEGSAIPTIPDVPGVSGAEERKSFFKSCNKNLNIVYNAANLLKVNQSNVNVPTGTPPDSETAKTGPQLRNLRDAAKYSRNRMCFFCSVFFLWLQVVFIMLGPFFSHQVPLDLEYDSDEAVESQNEDDQPSIGVKDTSEGTYFFLKYLNSQGLIIVVCSLV
jgi:hypothetical protein